MDFSEFLERILSYAQSNTVIVIIVALVVLFFVYRKLKLLFTLLILGLFLAALFYMITSMAGSGSEQKRKLIPREETQSDRNP